MRLSETGRVRTTRGVRVDGPHGGPCFVCLVSMLLLFVGCDTDSSSDGSGDGDGVRLSRVAIVETESLERPVVGNERVYVPTTFVTFNGSDGEVPIAVAHITVTTTDPNHLSLRLVDGRTSEAVALSRVAQTDGESFAEGAAPSAQMEGALTSGGAYWLVDSEGGGDGLRYGIGFAVPEGAFEPGSLIEAYVSRTTGGSPVGGDRIELARGFYYLTALGDSAMWGNGLREDDKFTSLVAQTIQEATGLRVIRTVSALSGATIVPGPDDRLCTVNCSGEVPTVLTSITLQAQSMAHPESVDLVLLDGCGNDIGLDVILSTEDMTSEIDEAARLYCYAEMANLILRVRATAPDAPIVVTGYFPFVSMESDVSYIFSWAESRGIDLGDPAETEQFATAMVANSDAFHADTTAALRDAVELVSTIGEAGPPILFADAGFGPENATFAADAWLWGFTDDAGIADALDIDLKFVPEDPLLGYRAYACLDADAAHNYLNCVYASAGHPNPTGAQAYARAIIDALRQAGVLPAAPAAGESKRSSPAHD